MKTILALLLLSAQEPKAGEEPKVRAALERLGEALTAKDGAKIVAQFHVDRMAGEFAAKLPEGERDVRAIAERLRTALPTMVLNSVVPGAAWEKIRPLGVRLMPGGEVAEALCRATMGGERTKVRFWLARDDGAWKVYDFEFPEFAMRFSTIVGLMVPAVGAGEASRRALARGLSSLQRAVVQAAAGEPDEAREALALARKVDLPDPFPAWIDLLDAGFLYALEKNEEALQAADGALKRSKDLHVAHHVRGLVLAAMERHEDAIAAQQEYLRLAGDDPDAWLAVGEGYETLDRADEAIAAFRKGAACDEEDHENRLNLGRLLVEKGKGAEAAPFLLEAARNAPEDEDVFDEAADLLSEAGEHAALLKLAEDRIARAPDEAIPLLWKGRALRKLGRAEEAVKALRLAREKDSENDGILEALALSLADSGGHDEALKLAEAYGGRNADEPETARLLAHVHARAGRTKDALRELGEFLTEEYDAHEEIAGEPAFKALLATGDGRALLERAKAKSGYMEEVQELEGWKEREDLSRRFLEGQPEDPDGWYFLGQALRRLGRAADAEAALRKGMPLGKDSRSFRNELARALAAQGKVAEALELAEKFSDEAGLKLRAVVYAIAGKTDDAIKALRELLEADPDWRTAVEEDDDLKDLRKLPGVQELLRRAKGE
jgi:tetratricopeptide (TPR) repeat protein